MQSLKNFIKNISLSLLGLGLLTTPAQAASIITTSNANDLVKTIVGSGITVSNATYKGAPIASGIFTGGLTLGIGIEQGIILTTGNATLAVGPNSSQSATVNNNSSGDTDLNSLISGLKTVDASVLEFEFTSKTGNLVLNYVFASEEYNKYVYTKYNDVFGFFLDGHNIALIPGTSIPVSINNVNGGQPFGSQNASHPQFFNNNALLNGKASYNTQYNGFTNVFTAKVHNLGTGKHRIKIAIADAADSSLDSAVFIQAESFSSEPSQDVPEPTSVLGVLAFGVIAANSCLKRKHTAVNSNR